MSISLTRTFFQNARGFTLKDGNGITWAINANTNEITAAYTGNGSSGAADPAAKVGLTTVNGSAATFMRSDAAPPVDQGIAPTWTAIHTFSVPPVIKGLSWTAPTLLNSWVYYGSPYNPPGYYKDSSGRIWLRGLVKSGTSATAIIFQLPAGYRPTGTQILTSVANNALCVLNVDSSGNVSAVAGGSTAAWTALDGVSFTTF